MNIEKINILKKILKEVISLCSTLYNHHARHENGGGD